MNVQKNPFSKKKPKIEEPESDSSEFDPDLEDSDEDDDEDQNEKDQKPKEGEEDDEDPLIKKLKQAREKTERTSPPDLKFRELVSDISFHPLDSQIAVSFLTGRLQLQLFQDEMTSNGHVPFQDPFNSSRSAMRGIKDGKSSRFTRRMFAILNSTLMVSVCSRPRRTSQSRSLIW